MKAIILKEGETRTTHSVEEVTRAWTAGEMIWVNVQEQTPEVDVLLAEVLGIHPLTIEDIWAESVTPKVEGFDDYLYVRVHGIVPESEPLELSPREVDILIAPRFIVVHDTADVAVGTVEAHLTRKADLLGQGPAWVAHRVLDVMVDRYVPMINRMSQAVGDLETAAIRASGDKEGKQVLGSILSLKRSLHALRRISIPQREILHQLARGDHEEIPKDARTFYRDVYDHFARVTDVGETYDDMVTSSFQVYLNMQSNRMNEIMKTLTLISTIMLPLTFVAGLYGMNFAHMPELQWRFGYAYALGLMALVTVGILAWFKRKKWL